MSAAPFPISDTQVGRVAILWRGEEAARRRATADNSRFKAVFAALTDVGVKAEPVVYEDDVLDAVRAQLAAVDGVLVWVNPIHEGRNRAILDALLREVAARGVWVSAHPDVILKMGTKEVLYRTRTMSWGSDTVLYRTAEAMRVELPARLAAGPRVVKRNRGNAPSALERWIDKLPRDRPIAVYCICGFQVSGTAVTELRRRGYDARALVGGITAWHAIGGATVPLDTSTHEGSS